MVHLKTAVTHQMLQLMCYLEKFSMTMRTLPFALHTASSLRRGALKRWRLLVGSSLVAVCTASITAYRSHYAFCEPDTHYTFCSLIITLSSIVSALIATSSSKLFTESPEVHVGAGGTSVELRGYQVRGRRASGQGNITRREVFVCRSRVKVRFGRTQTVLLSSRILGALCVSDHTHLDGTVF